MSVVTGKENVPLGFLWLEITGRCQLECVHCYAASGPGSSHGIMTEWDWCRVIDQAAALGVRMVQFIGGEPTLHPGLPALMERALTGGMTVEVYTNLVGIGRRLWRVLERPGVRLATSYHSVKAEAHEAITGRRGSHERTLRNLKEALRRGIPVRVGVVEVLPGQEMAETVAELEELGVSEIRVDRVRRVGRGAGSAVPDLDQLCGHCGEGKLAISPEGEVWPCVFSRWLRLGNVRESSLAEVYLQAKPARRRLAVAFADRVRGSSLGQPCDPDRLCAPTKRCDPDDGNPGPVCVPHLRCSPFRPI
ncbi:MAG TPA: radical SAM protein [Candidatus Dormibacteraeota bacterium]|nr:radical SAM protein [Candidatus Dormibacteraeota bacterium]